MDDGELHPSEEGTPQGGSISVLLSNVYLHYVLDLWFERIVKPRLKGEAYLVRYIDDFVLCFQYREDALRVQEVLRKWLAKFGLALEPTKTKLVEFGRFAQRHAGKRGRKRPETIYFLGFTHYWGRSRRGCWVVMRKTAKDRVNRGLKRMYDWCKQHRHLKLREQHAILCRKLRGHDAYYGITGNGRALSRYRESVKRIWRKWLNRRSRRPRLSWERFQNLLRALPLPPARVVHSIYAAKP